MNPFLPNTIIKGSRIQTMLECLLLSIRLPIFLGLTLQIIIFNDLLFRKLQNLELRQGVHKFIRIIILLHNFFIGRALHSNYLYYGYFQLHQQICLYCCRWDTITQSQCSQMLLKIKSPKIYNRLAYYAQEHPPQMFLLLSPTFLLPLLMFPYTRERCDTNQQVTIRQSQIHSRLNRKDIRELMELIEKQRCGPLIVFWEGGVSNGQHFLKIDELMIQEAGKINSYSKQKQHVAKYNNSNPTGFVSILTNSRMLLVGNSWMRMLYNLLVNWSCGLQIHFMKLPSYAISDCRLSEIYNQFVHQMLKRKLSKKNWMDYRTKFIRDIV